MDIFTRTYKKDYRLKRCAIIAVRLNERKNQSDPGDARDTAIRCVRFRDFLVRNRRATSGAIGKDLLVGSDRSFPPFGPSKVITAITVSAAPYSYSERHTRANPAAERDAESGR